MSSSDDDIALSQRSRGDVDEEKPLASLKKRKADSNGKKAKRVKKEKKKKSTQDKSDKPRSKTKVKQEPVAEEVAASEGPDVKVEDKKESSAEIDEDEKFRWWEAETTTELGYGTKKWDTLEHNGVLFPPPYEPLPSHVKLYYDLKPVNLPVAAEEVAGFFGAMLESDHCKNPTFQKNFFDDFLEVLKESGGCDVNIIDFDKLDFSRIHEFYTKQREDKKLLSREEKKRLKEEKEAIEEPYKTCLLNGRKEAVGNFRVEPPGLFRGRGAHPKTGKLKKRVFPEDITLNLSEGARVPDPPPGHQWGEVRHDNTVAWLAMWRENIADSFKYVKFAPTSSIKGLSDFKKFETARNLKHHIEAIRADYRKLLKDPLMQNRQMATATYLIDVFALRAGGEKGEDEADTVGCCSLRYEHITLKPPNTVIFDFLGKDSIRYYQEVEVDKQVFKNLRIFKKAPKQPGDDLFDRISPLILNKQFQKYMKGLTAKVFRTYNASKTMQDQIDMIENTGSVAEKVVKFNAANRAVAILCNHQRSVSKAHSQSVSKIQDRVLELNWQKRRLLQMILQLDETQRKKDPKLYKFIDTMGKEEIQRVHESIRARMIDQATKKLAREKEKAAASGVPLTYTDEDHAKKLESIDELSKEYARELETDKPELPKNTSVEKLQAQLTTVENRISNTLFQLKDKEDNSEVSLGTSKLNYIDPRLTVMFLKKFDVPIEKLFAKTLREKFKWAIELTDENWRF